MLHYYFYFFELTLFFRVSKWMNESINQLVNQSQSLCQIVEPIACKIFVKRTFKIKANFIFFINIWSCWRDMQANVKPCKFELYLKIIMRNISLKDIYIYEVFSYDIPYWLLNVITLIKRKQNITFVITLTIHLMEEMLLFS